MTRALLQQALVFADLIKHGQTVPLEYHIQVRDSLIEALRAELAKPAQEPCQWVGLTERERDGITRSIQGGYGSDTKVAFAIEAALREKNAAQPAQEPTRSQKLRDTGITRRPKGWCKDGDESQPAQEPVALLHLTKLLEAMNQETNAKLNMNEWLRSSPAMAIRSAQAEDEWIKSAKHLIATELEARKYVETTSVQPAQELTDEQKQEIHNQTGAGHALICLVESYIRAGGKA